MNENAWISIKISLHFVLNDAINNIPALVQIMTGRRPGDKPLSEQIVVNLLMHICVTRPQWVLIGFFFSILLHSGVTTLRYQAGGHWWEYIDAVSYLGVGWGRVGLGSMVIDQYLSIHNAQFMLLTFQWNPMGSSNQTRCRAYLIKGNFENMKLNY